MLRFLPKLVVGLKGKSAKGDPLLKLLTASLGTHFKESNSLLTSKEIKLQNVDLPQETLDQINAILPDGTRLKEVKISEVTIKVTSLKEALGNTLAHMPFKIDVGNVRVTIQLTPDVDAAPAAAAAPSAAAAAAAAVAPAAGAADATAAGGLFANEKIATALRGIFKGLRIEVRRLMFRVIVRTRGTSSDGRRAQNHSYCLSAELRRIAFVSTDARGREVSSAKAEHFEKDAQWRRARASKAAARKRRASTRDANECGGGIAPAARVQHNTGISTFYRALTLGDIEVRLDPVTGSSTAPIYFVRNSSSGGGGGGGSARAQPRLRCSITAHYAELEVWPTGISVDVDAAIDIELNVDDIARMMLLNRQMNIATNARAMRRAADSVQHENTILGIAGNGNAVANAVTAAVAAEGQPQLAAVAESTFNAFNMDLEAALNLSRVTLTVVHDIRAEDDGDDDGGDDEGGWLDTPSKSTAKTAAKAKATRQHIVQVSLDTLRLDSQIEHVTGRGWSDDWRVSLSLKEALCTQRDVGGPVGQAAAGVLFALAAPPMPSGAPPQSECAFEVCVRHRRAAMLLQGVAIQLTPERALPLVHMVLDMIRLSQRVLWPDEVLEYVVGQQRHLVLMLLPKIVLAVVDMLATWDISLAARDLSVLVPINRPTPATTEEGPEEERAVVPLMLMLKLAAVQLSNRWAARGPIGNVGNGATNATTSDVPLHVLAGTDAAAKLATIYAAHLDVNDGSIASELRVERESDPSLGGASRGPLRSRSRSDASAAEIAATQSWVAEGLSPRGGGVPAARTATPAAVSTSAAQHFERMAARSALFATSYRAIHHVQDARRDATNGSPVRDPALDAARVRAAAAASAAAEHATNAEPKASDRWPTQLLLYVGGLSSEAKGEGFDRAVVRSAAESNVFVTSLDSLRASLAVSIDPTDLDAYVTSAFGATSVPTQLSPMLACVALLLDGVVLNASAPEVLREWTECLVGWVKDAVVPLVRGRIDYERERRVKIETQRKAVAVKNRKTLVLFYSRHNPEKLADVDMLLNKYEGRMEMLFEAMRKKYGEVGGDTNEFAVAEFSGSAPLPTAPSDDDAELEDDDAEAADEDDVEDVEEASTDVASSWPSTLHEFARRLPEVRWIVTVRSSAIRRANAPLLPWPIQRMQLVSSPLEATLHNFELQQQDGVDGAQTAAAPLFNRVRREHAERMAAAAAREIDDATTHSTPADKISSISTAELNQARRASFIQGKVDAAKTAATASQDVSEEDQVRLVLTLFYAKRAPEKLFEVFDIMSAYNCPSGGTNKTSRPLRPRVYDAELFRRLAHNYGSVVEVIAPMDDFNPSGSSNSANASTYESALQQQQLVRQGYLLKQCGKVWRRVFFVLTPQSLSFYVERDRLGALQVSSIAEVRIKGISVNGRQRKGFSVSVSSTLGSGSLLASIDTTNPALANTDGNEPFKISCAASSTEERNAWVKAIARTVRRYQLEAAFSHVAVAVQRAFRSQRAREATRVEQERVYAASKLQGISRGRFLRAMLPKLLLQLENSREERETQLQSRAALQVQSWVRCTLAARDVRTRREMRSSSIAPQARVGGGGAMSVERGTLVSEAAVAMEEGDTLVEEAEKSGGEALPGVVAEAEAADADAEAKKRSLTPRELLDATARDLETFYEQLGQTKLLSECATIASKYRTDFGESEWTNVLRAKLGNKYAAAEGYVALPVRNGGAAGGARARAALPSGSASASASTSTSTSTSASGASAPVDPSVQLRGLLDFGSSVVSDGRAVRGKGKGLGLGLKGLQKKMGEKKLGGKLGNKLKGKLSDTKLGTNLVTGLGKLKRQAQQVRSKHLIYFLRVTGCILWMMHHE